MKHVYIGIKCDSDGHIGVGPFQILFPTKHSHVDLRKNSGRQPLTLS